MRILDRYTLRTFLLPWLCVTLGFGFLFVIIDLIEQIGDFLDGGAPLWEILVYYIRFLSLVWVYIAPVTLLLGLLFALYQLSRNNEIIAMRASGISIYRVLTPFLILGAFISGVTTVITTSVAPKNQEWTEQYLTHMKRPDANVIRKIRFRNPVNLRSWDIDTLNLDTMEIENVRVNIVRPETGALQRVIIAQRGVWLDTHWAFYEVTVRHHSEQGYPQGSPEEEDVMLMLELTESPEQIVRENMPLEYMTSREMRRFLDSRPVSERTRVDLLTQIHMRRAHPWLSLVTVMLAVPFSTQTARKGVFTGIMLCLLLFFSLFFTMTVFKAFGQGGHVTPWLAGWFPTLAYGVLGIYMLRKLR
ncbi:MAG: LptF/LptG family permease [Verrucomicrobia bacterium]|nr:LptF/LptG family permease [Verrucomicrobiota bacterium]MCH8514167.1 LptF/LptG family permease [Kiritimatiellia bacterium]